MRYFLLLYPVREYVEVFTKGHSPSVTERLGGLFRTLIEERYRRKGFKVAKVFFSTIADSSRPDLFRAWKFIPIEKDDIVIACGVTFEEHRWAKVYPKESRILSFLQPPIEELVIGGFHLWDCVEKMAKYAFEQGIPVSVDEDLTEVLFFAVIGREGIPISREESIRQTKEEMKRLRGTVIWEIMREVRQGSPWLLQVED